jgi:hypothetical protein
MLITRGAARAASRDQTLSIPMPRAQDYRPPMAPSTTWSAPRPGTYQGQGPRFEPIITGTVVLVGLILAAIIGGGLALIWLVS